jgi:hypothetical protein
MFLVICWSIILSLLSFGVFAVLNYLTASQQTKRIAHWFFVSGVLFAGFYGLILIVLLVSFIADWGM